MSSHEAERSVIGLSNADIIRFAQASHALRQLGHRVDIPFDLNALRAAQLTIRCRISPCEASSTSGLLSFHTLLEFRWEVVLNGKPIDIAELEALADEKRSLLQWRGNWIFVDRDKHSPEALAALIARLKQTPIQQLSPIEAFRVLLGKDSDWNGIPIELDEGESIRLDWFNSFCGRAPFCDVGKPAGISSDVELRHYQQHGLNWLTFMCANGFGAMLADDMGLGKTLQTLAWLQHRKNHGCQEPCLLICPTTLLWNWEKEAARFTPSLKLFRHHGPDRAKTRVAIHARSRGRDLVITTYGVLSRDVEELAKVNWSAVILDEAQNIKTPNTAVSEAARKLARETPFRLALTGTPIENGALDLWTQFDFLNPGLLGTQDEFEDSYAALFNQKELREAKKAERQAAAALLRRITKPFILRRMKSEPKIAPELPEKIEKDELCFLTREQATLYRAVLKDAEDELASATKSKRSAAVLRLLHKLKQACNHPAHVSGDGCFLERDSGKLIRLMEMLRVVLERREKALIFTQYPGDKESGFGHRLCTFLDDVFGDEFKVAVDIFDGKTSDKQTIVARFQSNPKYALLVLSLKAGGTGLNLTAANHVFHYDRWWNPAIEDQATDRAYRIGQTKNVNVYKFVCVGTLEEQIAELILRKRELANLVVGEDQDGSLAAYLAQMSNAELQTFFALRDGAVCEE